VLPMSLEVMIPSQFWTSRYYNFADHAKMIVVFVY
jgi:hypothetical protein